MVSEKIIVILIIVAIVLSIASIAITLSSVNTQMIQGVSSDDTPDNEAGKVSIVVLPTSNPPV